MFSDPLSCSPPQSQQCQVQTADVGPCSPILTIFSVNWQEDNPNSPPHLRKSTEREADNKDGLAKDNKERIIQLQNTQSWKRPTGLSPTPAVPWVQRPAGNKSKHWSLLGWRKRLCLSGQWPKDHQSWRDLDPLSNLFLLFSGMRRKDPQ